jgi:hypothetical protein
LPVSFLESLTFSIRHSREAGNPTGISQNHALPLITAML